jgi:hypothetical protein
MVEDSLKDLEALGPRNGLISAIERYIRHVDNTIDFTSLVYKELRSYRPVNRKAVLESELAIVKCFEEILDRGCKEGIFSVSDTRLAARGIVSMAEMWAVKNWQYKEQCTLEHYIKFNTEQVLKQVGKGTAV